MFIISAFHNHCTHQAIRTYYLYKVNQTSKHIIMLVSISWSLWLSFVKWHDNELPRQSIRQQSMKPLESITSTKYPATRTSMSCQTFRSLHLPALNKEQIIIVNAIVVFNKPVHKHRQHRHHLRVTTVILHSFPIICSVSSVSRAARDFQYSISSWNVCSVEA